MKCYKIKKRLSAYFDGEIAEEEKKIISEHLAGCEKCQEELAVFSKVRDSLRVLRGMDVPPYFMTRLRQQIREETQPLPFFERIRSVVISAATAAAVVVSLLIGNQAGRILYQSIATSANSQTTETANIFGSNAFEEFPDGSLSDIYNDLITGGNSG
jgi:anti-sigma factor RsiW